MRVALLNRGHRRSRCLMTERGRPPSYWRPSGAPGGAAAYVTGRAHPDNGKSPGDGGYCCGCAWRAARPAKQASSACCLRAAIRPGAIASRVYPTCAPKEPISGKPEIGCAPSPHRETEKGKDESGPSLNNRTMMHDWSSEIAAIDRERHERQRLGFEDFDAWRVVACRQAFPLGSRCPAAGAMTKRRHGDSRPVIPRSARAALRLRPA